MTEENTEQNKIEHDWKKSLCTVTPLSKYLALALFIALPFLGFWFGILFERYTNTVCPEVTTSFLQQDTKVSDVEVQDSFVAKTVVENIESPDSVLQKVSNKFEKRFTDPVDFTFEWRRFQCKTEMMSMEAMCID